jgi:hypothetical protein
LLFPVMEQAGKQHRNPDRSYLDWIALSTEGGGRGQFALKNAAPNAAEP